MRINVGDVRQCLKSFDFKTLFREHLGWDNYQAALEIPVDGRTIPLSAIAQKRGFVAFVCDGPIPDRAIRLKIDHQTTKSVREHFVIYADRGAGQQVWQWVRREQGKPLASRDHRFNIRQSGDPLIQRLDQIAVSLEEEEQITVVDVAGRARAAFDVDRITKRFYDRFKAEHAAFLNFIKGIKADADLQWYTSLMLNRLMFIYFIQKKGFLDGDTDYLRNRLKMVEQARGQDKFQSFYRYFLLRLFHDGLGKSPEERRFDPIMEKLLGKVPFLNGGFFEVHDLEKRYPEIDIPDKGFEKLFDFFDQYSWHLDERPLRADNEINPDVVGYIFEKYINQKQMGAYYTKEDITEYISKNTVIPFIFDAAQKKCAIAFNPDSALWRLLRDNPDRYIYPAVRHGVVDKEGNVIPLPNDIAAGIKEVGKRDGWNRPATAPYALPTETWREHVARRQRCLDIREKLGKGEVRQINDLITLNLDIWQFARDAIVNAEGPELLRAFWHAIEKLTVLDPTCGSGAFLFAALRILETLYSDCLERMERFIEDIAGKPHHPEQYSDFKKVLAQTAKHPNERYFILKSIMINNLFGVDIMEEAIEICKLRLFLKLVAQVEAAEQIEPLPDIDFNIRTGNTLVGYATEAQAREAFTHDEKQGKLMFGDREDAFSQFEESVKIVEAAFRQFRALQTTHGGKVTREDKQELRTRLANLDAELDCYLASEYGIDIKKQKEFDAWKTSHQPFHWFVEFYGIMSTGGFDVVIGNPPYLEVAKLRGLYRVHGFYTDPCANLYALVLERSTALIHGTAHVGVIVPIGSTSLDETETLRTCLLREFNSIHTAHFAIRPAKLFTGVEQRLTIYTARNSYNGSQIIQSTKYNQWFVSERDHIFSSLQFTPASQPHAGSKILKTGNLFASSILRKVNDERSFPLSCILSTRGNHILYFHRTPGYWVRIMDFLPYFSSPAGDRSIHHIRELHCESKLQAGIAGAVVSSSLYFFWLFASGNCRNLTMEDVKLFPLGNIEPNVAESLASGFSSLMEDFKRNSFVSTRGASEFQQFSWEKAKPIIDEIDKVLAQHYGFTDEELDFIINYDIKYRMGNTDDENGDDG
jgi:hypothetical protein